MGSIPKHIQPDSEIFQDAWEEIMNKGDEQRWQNLTRLTSL